MNEPLCELNESEMASIEGGIDNFGCALLGAGAMAGAISGNWWFTAGMIMSAINGGCFC